MKNSNKRKFIAKNLFLKLLGFVVFAIPLSNFKAYANEVKADSLMHIEKTIKFPYMIKGRIADQTMNKGFAGARISLVGTQLSVMTDNDGNFNLNVPSLDGTLLIEAPGFNNQYTAIKGQTDLKIKIMESGEVPSFYNEQTLAAKNDFSISLFSKDYVSVDQDIVSRLNGEVRSLLHSGVDGNGAAVFARGLNSLSANTEPLYIIDGIMNMSNYSTSIFEGAEVNPLSLISPDDVEKITVVKNATAIYGSKGANGVILIQTRRSHNMATEITARISMGLKVPFKSIPMMNANEFRTYISDALCNMYNDNSTLLDKYNFLNDDQSSSYYNSSHNNTDWLKEINKTSLSQNYGISVRGGDEKALYSFSMGYVHNAENIDKTSFERLNVRFNSDISLTKKINLGLNIGFAQTIRNLFDDGIDEVRSPVFLALIKAPLFSPYKSNNNGTLSQRFSDTDELLIGNPVALVNNSDGISKNYCFTANAHPVYNITDKLHLGLLFGFSWDKLKENSFTPDYGIADVSLYNDQGDLYGIGKNRVQNQMASHSNLYSELYGKWEILKSTSHNLDLTSGYRYLIDSYQSDYGEGYNTGSDNMKGLSTTNSSLRTSTGVNEDRRSISWYGTSNYNFKNRYFLSGSFSVETSSCFGNRAKNALKFGGVPWGVFSSLFAGWIISSEKFMRKFSFINLLKLRADFNVAGNDDIQDYAKSTYFESISYMGVARGLTIANIGNNALKWETTSTFDLGLDFSLFNNRWNVKADVYSSRTKDLLTLKQLNEVAGLQSFWSNDGKLSNKGFEFKTNIRVLDEENWKLDVDFSVGHYKNMITSLANGSYTTDVCNGEILTAVHHPIGVFYGYKTLGVFSTTADAENANLSVESETGTLTTFKAGDMHFADRNNDHIIDKNDKQIIGNPNPDIYGSLGFNVVYRNLTLEALFTYSYGNDAYNSLRATLESGNAVYNQSRAMLNRWMAPGQITSVPRATYGDPMGNSRFSDRWIEDASYLRCKSISLSYKMPIKSIFLQGITIFLSANNLFTLTKYLGADPEFSYGNTSIYQGIDAGLIPSTRMYNFGININL